MTNEEARKAWEKLYSEIDKDNWLFVGTINPEMVALAIKALEERTHGEWVPVSERLPEERINLRTNDFEEVICTTVWDDVRHIKYGKPIGHDEPHFWYAAEIWDKYIIAWQYKPEPYKKGDQ